MAARKGVAGAGSVQLGRLPMTRLQGRAQRRQQRLRVGHTCFDPQWLLWRAACGMFSSIVFLQLIAIVVDDYDAAIAFFVEALGFELVEDSPSLTNAGNPKSLDHRAPGGLLPPRRRLRRGL